MPDKLTHWIQFNGTVALFRNPHSIIVLGLKNTKVVTVKKMFCRLKMKYLTLSTIIITQPNAKILVKKKKKSSKICKKVK